MFISITMAFHILPFCLSIVSVAALYGSDDNMYTYVRRWQRTTNCPKATTETDRLLLQEREYAKCILCCPIWMGKYRLLCYAECFVFGLLAQFVWCGLVVVRQALTISSVFRTPRANARARAQISIEHNGRRDTKDFDSVARMTSQCNIAVSKKMPVCAEAIENKIYSPVDQCLDFFLFCCCTSFTHCLAHFFIHITLAFISVYIVYKEPTHTFAYILIYDYICLIFFAFLLFNVFSH